MKEVYIGIEPEKARELLKELEGTRFSSRGIDRRAYLIGDIAVLKTDRMKLRNVVTRDDDLKLFDSIIETLLQLYKSGTAVVPILGYICDDTSEDGSGYIFEERAKGAEVYDDAVLTKYQVWARKAKGEIYLSTELTDGQAKEYLLRRTAEIAHAPQEQYDRLALDSLRVLEEDLLIDCNGKSNFFYDKDVGFQLIDLDAHNDFSYGLAKERPDIGLTACFCMFALCHFAQGTKRFAGNAMDETALAQLGNEAQRLKRDNKRVFYKCIHALRGSGIAECKIKQACEEIKILGLESEGGAE